MTCIQSKKREVTGSLEWVTGETRVVGNSYDTVSVNFLAAILFQRKKLCLAQQRNIVTTIIFQAIEFTVTSTTRNEGLLKKKY